MPHECVHEEQIRGISRKTSELEANAKYHEKHLDELNLSIKDLQHSIDNISDSINEFIKKCEDYYFNGFGVKIFGR